MRHASTAVTVRGNARAQHPARHLVTASANPIQPVTSRVSKGATTRVNAASDLPRTRQATQPASTKDSRPHSAIPTEEQRTQHAFEAAMDQENAAVPSHDSPLWTDAGPLINPDMKPASTVAMLHANASLVQLWIRQATQLASTEGTRRRNATPTGALPTRPVLNAAGRPANAATPCHQRQPGPMIASRVLMTRATQHAWTAVIHLVSAGSAHRATLRDTPHASTVASLRRSVIQTGERLMQRALIAVGTRVSVQGQSQAKQPRIVDNASMTLDFVHVLTVDFHRHNANWDKPVTAPATRPV